MDAKVNGENPSFYSPGAANLSGTGRRSFEWDLNDWNWDGDRFIATPLNAAASSSCRSKQLSPIPAHGGLNGSSSCSDADYLVRCDRREVEMEKRRKITVVEEDGADDRGGFSTLKLGEHAYPIAEEDLADWEGNNNKNSRVQSNGSNRGTCQVENCGADLSDAKDYHRRHKVCAMHAKASTALVGNTMQRFCQQCSRFHLLQEFDEGKRSCRRRLAGHNKRRRKNNPHTVASENALIDCQDGISVLIHLIKVLSNLEGNKSEQSHNQDLISHFVRNLATLAGSFDSKNLATLQQASQDPKKAGHSGPSSVADPTSNGRNISESLSPMDFSTNPNCSTEVRGCSRDDTNLIAVATSTPEIPQTVNVRKHSLDQSLQASQCQISSNIITENHTCPTKTLAINSLQKYPLGNSSVSSMVEMSRLRSFDLNNIYEDDDNDGKGSEKVGISANIGVASLDSPWDLQECHNSSPPQTSGSSGSSSAKSLASSDGNVQSRTDRIVFKLFGKDPNDFPLLLREQIVHWLSKSPTDLESYIRPGCVILTVYLRLPNSTWEKISCNLSSSLRRLVDLSHDDFWRTGLIYARVKQQTSFIYNGQFLLDIPVLHGRHDVCKIVSISPIAIPISGFANFIIKGVNLSQSTKRLLCAFEGKYLMQETTSSLVDETCTYEVNDGIDCLSFTCSVPNAMGRGFVEVEDNDLSDTFFPFIVAEPDMCSEIRMLETTVDVASSNNFHESPSEMQTRSRVLEFLHEMGWLLRQIELQSRDGHDRSHLKDFSLKRFDWLVKFSMEHEWCATVKKLLDILFAGAVNTGDLTAELALEKMALLHNAVEKNSRRMVEFLLRYVPEKTSGWKCSQECQGCTHAEVFLFRPDRAGPFGMTPVHFAASRSDTESVLDALTSDPGQVGIIAWNSARDDTFFTPADYARIRGFQSYVDLVEQKITSNSVLKHVVLDIPKSLPASEESEEKPRDDPTSPSKPSTCERGEEQRARQGQQRCMACSQQRLARVTNRNRNRNRSSLMYRPAMLSMVSIAAVCVCVGIILKGPPEVSNLLHPFRWELLGNGSI